MPSRSGSAGFCSHNEVQAARRACCTIQPELQRLIGEKEKVAQKCKQIRNLADPDVELALKARMKGGLKEEIEVETWLRLSSFCRQDSLDLYCFCVCFDLEVCCLCTYVD